MSAASCGIIGNSVYLGHTIMCKHETMFKVGILKKTPDADRIRVDNTYEPLVSQEMFFQLVKEYADRQSITEQLKSENQMEWVGRMNNCKTQAEEVIMAELIYV